MCASLLEARRRQGGGRLLHASAALAALLTAVESTCEVSTCGASNALVLLQAKKDVSKRARASGGLGHRGVSPTPELRQDGQRTVCIWASGQSDSLAYMYHPFMSTLVAGFSGYRDAGSWNIHNRSMVNVSAVASDLEQLSLRGGDIFIWIGNASPEWVPWAALSSRGVHTVYYQTEPEGPCTPLPDVMVSEMWDYSWRNIEKCKGDGKAAPPILRHVPSGFLSGFGMADHSSVWPKPTFFGYPDLRTCWRNVTSSFAGALQVEHDIWSQVAFDSFIASHSVFVDVPKFCDTTAGVVTSRMSQLLSAGAFVIALRSYPADEKEFAGLVTFAPEDQLKEAYDRIAGLDPAERGRRAAERLALFAERFSPPALFKRAGVYSLLDNMTASFP